MENLTTNACPLRIRRWADPAWLRAREKAENVAEVAALTDPTKDYARPFDYRIGRPGLDAAHALRQGA